jgi:hypothetical protein
VSDVQRRGDDHGQRRRVRERLLVCDSYWDSEKDEIVYTQDCDNPACASSVTHSAANDRAGR